MGAATATALVGTAISGYQAISSASEKKKVGDEIANYNRQDLVNSYRNMPLFTRGTDIMKEQSAINAASAIDTVRGGGARLVASTLPKIQSNLNKVDQEIALNLERQGIEREKMIAQGEERLTLLKEQRDIDNLNALSSQYNAAQQNFNQGLWGVASGVSSAARGLQTDKDNGDTWFNKG